LDSSQGAGADALFVNPASDPQRPRRRMPVVAAFRPSRHLVRRSGLVAIRGEAESHDHLKSVVRDPQRASAGRFCCDAAVGLIW
jgi:hypothetical protein